jgi:hypothetical protein
LDFHEIVAGINFESAGNGAVLGNGAGLSVPIATDGSNWCVIISPCTAHADRWSDQVFSGIGFGEITRPADRFYTRGFYGS